jgi:hypothetical protein
MIVSWLLLAMILVAFATFLTVSTILVITGDIKEDWFWDPIVVKKGLYSPESGFGVLPKMILNYLLMWLLVTLLFSLTKTDYGIKRQGLFFILDAIEALLYAINSLVGIVVRLLMSMFAQMVYLARLDRSLLPGSLDRYDKFYKTYTAYTYLEHCHTHPVFVTALYFLLAQPSAAHTFIGLDNQPTTSPSQRQRVRNRWQLLLTLVNNPGLVALRKHNLETPFEATPSFHPLSKTTKRYTTSGASDGRSLITDDDDDVVAWTPGSSIQMNERHTSTLA